MVEAVKEIVIAMLNNGYIEKLSNTNKNIENVNKAINEISKQLDKNRKHDFSQDEE